MRHSLTWVLNQLVLLSRWVRRSRERSTAKARQRNDGRSTNQVPQVSGHHHSIDTTPWRHPFLTADHILSFRNYSEQVWSFAMEYVRARPAGLSVAFLVNMAQNMYKWGCMAARYGARAELYVNRMDQSALNCPEWEEFDGEYEDAMDGAGFLARHPDIKLQIPCHRVLFQDQNLLVAYQEFLGGRRASLLRLLTAMPGIRHEVLLSYQGFYPYARWAAELERFDVAYAASQPFAAYASGRPYCVFSVGGDLQFDCGRGDDYGRAMVLGFNAAKFLMISNPHALGHSRRLGLTNGVYLPYPIDEERYCPGEAVARAEWESQRGTGVYVLTTARLDSEAKGFDDTFIAAIVEAAEKSSALHFVFLAWGNDSSRFERLIEGSPLRRRFMFLRPVGKRRLVDYYRSADVILDQLVYGYYGATALEAAAIGKPVVMKLRSEHYRPLYAGDIMPALNVGTRKELVEALIRLCEHPELRAALATDMRAWLVRNHGIQRTMPLLMALLGLTADRIALPEHMVSPLRSEQSQEEVAYHDNCLVPSS